MVEQFKLEDILALNPHIDEQMLEQVRELLRKIRENRTKHGGYNLVSPYAHRRITTDKEEVGDPRTVHVRRPIRR